MKVKQILSAVKVAALLVTFPADVIAEEKPLSLFVTTGQYFYDDDASLDDATPLTGGVGYDFTERWGGEVSLTSISTNPEDLNDEVDARHLMVDGLYYLGTEQWRPYLVAGLGGRELDASNTDSDMNTFSNLGLGVKNNFKDSWQFRGDVRAYHDLDESLTDYGVNIGFAYLIGGSSSKSATKPVTDSAAKSVTEVKKAFDVDGDGVSDVSDKCSNTPANTKVDASGCPLDSDGDGVYDYLDECAATSKNYVVDQKGCPKTLTEEVSIELKINFENNSNVVKQSYYSEIEKVAAFMNQYADTTVEIAGYTDDRGSESYNRNLSQRRADSVREVLINKFSVARDRVSAIGYGEANPIASNDTAEGRATNRRVVAKVSSTVEREVKK